MIIKTWAILFLRYFMLADNEIFLTLVNVHQGLLVRKYRIRFIKSIPNIGSGSVTTTQKQESGSLWGRTFLTMAANTRRTTGSSRVLVYLSGVWNSERRFVRGACDFKQTNFHFKLQTKWIFKSIGRETGALTHPGSHLPTDSRRAHEDAFPRKWTSPKCWER